MQTGVTGFWNDTKTWEDGVIPTKNDRVLVTLGEQTLNFNSPKAEVNRVILGRGQCVSRMIVFEGSLTLKGDSARNGCLVMSCGGDENSLAFFQMAGGKVNVENTIFVDTNNIGDNAGIVLSGGDLDAKNFTSGESVAGGKSLTVLGSQAQVSFSGDFNIGSYLFLINILTDEGGTSPINVEGTLSLNGDIGINAAKYLSNEPLILFRYTAPEDLIGVFNSVNIEGRKMSIDYFHATESGHYAVALIPED